MEQALPPVHIEVSRTRDRSQEQPTVRQRGSPASELPAHSEAAAAAETFAMHRMTQRNIPSWLVATMAAICAACLALPANAQMVRQADIDFEGSGFVTPAGMVHPSMYQGGVMQVGYASGYGDPMMSGYGGSCDAGGCDGYGGCDGACGGGGLYGGGCGPGGCGPCGCGSCGGPFQGGILGKLCANDGMCSLRHLCLFCRGAGCSACQGWGACFASCVDFLLPYSEGGLCAQRWYDVSVEGVFLGHSGGGASGVLTTDGVEGTPVLRLQDADPGDSMQGGVRVSAAMIFGVASNLELTYLGGQEWEDTAVGLPDPIGTPTLYSFISEFGTNPNDGFDDTDRSLVQTLESSTAFHSGEWNYRRRTMGPYCRFQGSWLVGLRYVRFDNRLIYSCLGENDNTVNANLPRFFSSNDKVKNNLFGPQAGFDLWWNVIPGVNFGFGMKGAWVQNDAKREMILTGNSLDPLATPGTIVVEDTRRNGTVIGELETTLIYRFTHSWSMRTSYYLLAIDDVAFGNVDGEVARAFVTVNPIQDPKFVRDSLVVQGVTFGAEYMW